MYDLFNLWLWRWTVRRTLLLEILNFRTLFQLLQMLASSLASRTVNTRYDYTFRTVTCFCTRMFNVPPDIGAHGLVLSMKKLTMHIMNCNSNRTFISVWYACKENNYLLVARVINQGFPEPDRVPNPKTRVWAVQKPRFSGLSFLPIFNANGIFSKPKWIKKTSYVRPYFFTS